MESIYAKYSDKDLIKMFTAENFRSLSKKELNQLFQETYNRKCAEYGVQKPAKVRVGASILFDSDYSTTKEIVINYKNLKKVSTETSKLQTKFQEINSNNVGLYYYDMLNKNAYYDKMTSLKTRFLKGENLSESEKINFAFSYAYDSIKENYRKSNPYSSSSYPEEFNERHFDSITCLRELESMNALNNANEFQKVNSVNDYDASKVLEGYSNVMLMVFDSYKEKFVYLDDENYNKTGEIRDSELKDFLFGKEKFAILINKMFKDAVQTPLDEEVSKILDSSLTVDKKGDSKYRSMIINNIKYARSFASKFKKAELSEKYENKEDKNDYIPMNI